MYGIKEILKKELHQAESKGELTPSDLEKIKCIAESIYYMTAAMAMEENYGEYSSRSYPMYARDSYYDSTSGRRMRDSMGRYTNDGYPHDGYSSHDLESKKRYLEEMMRDARTAEEKEMFRRKLDELNRQM